jgi:hypothetical protein
LLTLAICVVVRGLAHAQSLTSADVLAPEGVPFTALTITDFIPWDTLVGTGVTWDYTWITVDSTEDQTFTVIPLSDAPDAPDYPVANRVVRSVSGADDDYIIDRFFDLSSGHLNELGSVGPVLSYVYEMPETIHAFPMTLGDIVHGDYCFISDGFGTQYHFCGESYVTFDAEGSLVLPYGTFTNVKHVTHWHSSFETTEPSTDSSYSVQQQWFLPGMAFPVLDASIFIAQNGDLYPSAHLLDQASFTAVAETAAPPSWSLRPNPANASVQLGGLPADTRAIELLTADGRLLRRDAGSFSTGTTLALEDLPDGLYLVRVIGQRESSAQRLVKGR